MSLPRNTEEEVLLADVHQALDDFRLFLRGRATTNTDDNNHALRVQLENLEDMLREVTDSRYARSLMGPGNVGVDDNTSVNVLRFILSTARNVTNTAPTKAVTNPANSRLVQSLRLKISSTRKDWCPPRAEEVGDIALSPGNSLGDRSSPLRRANAYRQGRDRSTSDPVPSPDENNHLSSGKLKANHDKAMRQSSSRHLVPKHQRFRVVNASIPESPALKLHQLDHSPSEDVAARVKELLVSVRASPGQNRAFVPAPLRAENTIFYSLDLVPAQALWNSKTSTCNRPLPAIPSGCNNISARSIETREADIFQQQSDSAVNEQAVETNPQPPAYEPLEGNNTSDHPQSLVSVESLIQSSTGPKNTVTTETKIPPAAKSILVDHSLEPADSTTLSDFSESEDPDIPVNGLR
ncbi:hypothetical protein D9756_007981 [Leucocoprinus leucothites]|uniref:Uncharacterized protein n=1 Tax=Leucocoprinus leucothites TaxID=201217 RepID=A0A8H5D6S2_9AGAR|nr:hypothetical protein D9756_007981 [Leucoagaricus leucothites]